MKNQHDTFFQDMFDLYSTSGVATSVAGPPNFDSEVAKDYAIKYGFRWLQLYANPTLINDADLRLRLKESCKRVGIKLIVHAPGTLTIKDAEQTELLQACDEVLDEQVEKFVVVHYDQRQSVEESIQGLYAWFSNGFIPCLENYHVLKGKQAGEEAYFRYLQTIGTALKRNIGVVAVLDIPRAFHAKLQLEDKAFEIWNIVFKKLAYLNCRIFLHLIDLLNSQTKRTDFCAVGDGIIPYDRLIPLLFQNSCPEAIIFEFEDKNNPLKSREFISRIFQNKSTSKS